MEPSSLNKSFLSHLRLLRLTYTLGLYFSLGLCLIFSLLYLARYLDVSFFVLLNRGMVEQSITDSIFSPTWDIVLWGGALLAILSYLLYRVSSHMTQTYYRIAVYAVSLALLGGIFLTFLGLTNVVLLVLVSCLLLGLCFAFPGILFGKSQTELLVRLLLGAGFFVMIVELAALVFFNGPLMLNLSPQLSPLAVHWNAVALSLFNLTYPILPYIYLLFVLLGVSTYLVRAFSLNSLVARFSARWSNELSSHLINLFALDKKCDFKLNFKNSRLALVIAIAVSAGVSCLFVVLTLLPWVNPTGMLVSADAPAYYQWIDYMHNVNFDRAMSFAFSNDRALFLILAYALSFFVSPIVVVQSISALLIVAFGIVSLLVLRLVVGIREIWVLGLLLVPFSFQALGLIYAGYFANMLALILVFTYVVLFFKLLKHWSALGFFALLATSMGILFSHSWTWFIFAISLLLFLFLEWRVSRRGQDSGSFRVMIVFVSATLVVGLFCDLSRRLLGSVSSSASVLVTAQSSLSFPNLGFLVEELGGSVNFILGGVFANGILAFLAITGFLVLLRFKSPIGRLFISWIFVGCVTILFAADSFVFDRFLFLMPWAIFSALGLFVVARGFVKSFGRWQFWLFLFVLIVFFLVLLNSSLAYLFNINIW